MSKKLSNLRGFICLVTGASRGIGKGVAIGLGECGATVYITGRTYKPSAKGEIPVVGSLEETASEINARGGVAIPVAVDHSDDSQVINLFSRIRQEQNGRLDVLVNNAFAGGGVIFNSLKDNRKFWELLPDESPMLYWDSVNGVGLRNHYICSVLAVRMMLEYRGELNKESENGAQTSKPAALPRPGLIFNITSLGSIRYFFGVTYGVGKCAIDRMTADMTTELQALNKSLSVISVMPGVVRTEELMSKADNKIENLEFDMNLSESPELTGRIIAAISMETREDLLKRSGRVFIVADVANSLSIRDIDGKSPISFRSYRFLLQNAGWKRLASFSPSFLKAPYCLINAPSPRF